MSTYDTPIPGVAQYGQAALTAKTAYQNALTRLNQQRSQTLRSYGFQGDINAATGVVQNVHTDPNNPYGQFQQLNAQQADAEQAAMFGAQERGLGTGGGLAAQIRNKVHSTFGGQDAALGQGLIDQLGQYQDQQNQAATSRDSALYQSELAAAQQAIQGGDFNPGDYSGIDWTAYGSGDAPPTDTGGLGNPPKAGTNPGAWGPAPSAATRRIIRTIPSVKPSAKPAATKPMLPKPKPAATINRSAAVPTKKKGR